MSDGSPAVAAPLTREFPAVEWDDTYPTEMSMAAFKAVDWLAFSPEDGGRVLRRELAECARNCCASYDESDGERYGKPVTVCEFSTGGWSGAEELIDALLSKFWIKYHHVQWNRGGHYVFEVPRI